MSAYLKVNNDPELINIKTKYDQIKEFKYRTERHDHENILNSLIIDNEYYRKKYKN